MVGNQYNSVSHLRKDRLGLYYRHFVAIIIDFLSLDTQILTQNTLQM